MWRKPWKCLDLQNMSFIPIWTDHPSMPCYSTVDDFLWVSFEFVLHDGAEWLGLAGVAALAQPQGLLFILSFLNG